MAEESETLAAINKLGHTVDLHVQKDADRDLKTNKMYEILVTGNGKPSMEQRVSAIEDWISGERKFLWILISTIIVTMVGGISWLINTVIALQSELQAISRMVQ